MSVSTNQWRLLFLPGFASLLYCLHLAYSFVKRSSQLDDPGTGWHLATGRQILTTHNIPRMDDYLFSFSSHDGRLAGVDWLFDLWAAWLERLGGLPLFTTCSAVVFALLPVLLYRRMIHENSHVVISAICACGAYIVLLMHALARPLIFTYLFFAILLDTFIRLYDGRSLGWRWLLFPMLGILWVNFHGGFLSGIALAGIFAGCGLLRFIAKPIEQHRLSAVLLSGAFLLFTLSTLVNPCGWEQHAFAKELLSLKCIRLWQEFASPDFWNGGHSTSAYRLFILALLAASFAGAKPPRFPEMVLVCGLLAASLQSVRHANLFVLVSAPVLASQLTLLAKQLPRLTLWLDRFNPMEQRSRSHVWQIPCAAILFGSLAMLRPEAFPRDLLGTHLSHESAKFIEQNINSCQRMFNFMHTGGVLIERFYPRLRVFSDDRGVYGDAFFNNIYFPIVRCETNCFEILDRQGITSALVDSNSALSTLLESNHQWVRVHSDSLNRIYFKKDTPSQKDPW